MKWAVDSKADIISLSAAFFQDETALRIAVQDVIAAGVVVIASTAGEGYRQQQAYPAKYPGVLKIAATDLNGKETPESLKEDADYMLPGENIVARTSFLGMETQTDKISGTSVATAIAAGIASLILACDFLSLSTQNQHEPWVQHAQLKQIIVRRVMDEMVGKPSNKFVKPWLVFDEADQGKWGEASRTLSWLKSKKF